MTSTVSPHALTGMCTGTSITLPETTPGECDAPPTAPASAKAGAAAAPTAIMVPAARVATFVYFTCDSFFPERRRFPFTAFATGGPEIPGPGAPLPTG